MQYPSQVSNYPSPQMEREPFSNPLHLKEQAPYVFPGIWPFIERAANVLGCDLHQFGRAKGLWHVSQIQSALGQVPSLDRQSQHDCMKHAHQTRMSLASALEGVDMAIREVVTAMDLPLPPYLETQPAIPSTPPIDETIETFDEPKPKAPKSTKGSI
jgi:hypothetical protein